MATQNRQWILARRPVGEIKDGDLVFRADPIRREGRSRRQDGMALARSDQPYLDERYWSIYAAGGTRGTDARVDLRHRCEERVGLGRGGCGRDGTGNLERLCLRSGGNGLAGSEDQGIPLKDVFGQMCLIGPTAYFGLTDIGAPKIGETLVVSGAAGAVGSIAGQLGKVLGCKTVGIAGGKEKCASLTRDYGFDHAIDYKSETIEQHLRAICPEGIDIYFDNVGGETLNTNSRPNEPVWPHRPVRHDLGL